MKIYEILYECQEVYVDEDYVDDLDDVLDEAAIRQFKKQNGKLTKKYRCTSGPKAGKIVSDPCKCGQRKDPKKVRQGRKTMRSKKGIIQRKGTVSKRKYISRLVSRMNKKLAGK